MVGHPCCVLPWVAHPEDGGWRHLSAHEYNFQKVSSRDFPGGAVVKNPPANAGDTGSSPGLGRSHMPQSN